MQKQQWDSAPGVLLGVLHQQDLRLGRQHAPGALQGRRNWVHQANDTKSSGELHIGLEMPHLYHQWCIPDNLKYAMQAGEATASCCS